MGLWHKLYFFNPFNLLNPDVDNLRYFQIDSSTIDGNVEYVHYQNSCILTSQVSIQFLCPTKILILVTILE